MKIYIFDDKAENVAAAERAIEASGHEFASRESVPPMTGKSAVKMAELVASGNLDRNKAGTVSAMLNAEIKGAVASMKECEGGIITDLMFHIGPHHLDGPQPPAGLLVALSAVSAGVPVVICTDASEVGGHHAEAVSWIFDGYVNRFRDLSECPVGWVDDKDWARAVQLLAERCDRQTSTEVDKV